MLKRFMRMVDGETETDEDALKKMDQTIDPNSIFDEKCIMEAKEWGVSLNELRNYKLGKGCKPLPMMDFHEVKELIEKEKKILEEEDNELKRDIIISKIECLEAELVKKINDIL